MTMKHLFIFAAFLVLFPLALQASRDLTLAPEGEVDVIITYFKPEGVLRKFQADRAKEIIARGGKIKFEYSIIPAIAARVPAALMGDLEIDARVKRVELDHLLYPNLVPNDPSLINQWGLNNTGQTGGTIDADIDAVEAWDIETGSSSMLIAVVDTGAQVEPGNSGTVTTHPDLAANIWTNPDEIPGDGIDNDANGFVDDIHGWNFFDNAPWVFFSAAEDAHGTHVSGIIGAAGDNGLGVSGVNLQVQMMILKFIGPFSGATSDAIAAIQYASDKNVRVINASWGGEGFNQSLKDAIEACGCVFVAAAGNGGLDQIGDDTDITPHYPSAYNSTNIIAVAATDDDDALTSFSNFGATSVDLSAPGASILSTIPINSYDFFDGTSMATPHVSGVAGLLLSQMPSLTPGEVKDRILNNVDPIPGLSGITVTGGRLNAANALSPDPPVLSISSNQVSFTTGETLIVTINRDNPGFPLTADFYAGVILPQFSTVFSFTSPGMTPGSFFDFSTLVPFDPGVDLSIPFTINEPNFHDYTWTGGEPSGNYLLYLAAAVPGAFADGTNDPGDIYFLATAPFNFNP